MCDNQKKVTNNALNTILYGPPGTGKTYATMGMAVNIINPEIQANGDIETIRAKYKEFVDSGHIKFCTFHQSYGYEEFVEGLRIGDGGECKVVDGIFKKICNELKEKNASVDDYFNKDNCFYIVPLCFESLYKQCISNDRISTLWGGSVDYTGFSDATLMEEKYKESVSIIDDEFSKKSQSIIEFRLNINIGDIVFLSHSGKLKAIAKVTSEYLYDADSDVKHFRKVQWMYKDLNIDINLIKKQFIPKPICKIDKKFIDFDILKKYISDLQKYVLIIDEINRANISKIFGELITLIEPDKRLGAKNEIRVELPYSSSECLESKSEPFGVPSNLYIIGTMNTADRSIALLDTALRRRFKFEELMPDYSKLPIEDIDGVNIRLMLKTINDRIEFLYDRDHTIGHAYFIEAKNGQDLIDIMTGKVFPLLQEYFYDDWEKIELILGGASSKFLEKHTCNAEALFVKTMNGGARQKNIYRLVKEANFIDLKLIYEGQKL